MRTTSPILAGRRAELALLTTALQAARRGAGGAVFLRGEPGAGKSRLVSECTHQAYVPPMAVLRGRASPTGMATPVRPLVEALASQLRTAGPPQNAELDPYRPALGRLIPEWRVTGATGSSTTTVELSEALLRLLTVLGRSRGTLLVLEDLHDADPETLAVLEYLVDNVAGLPVLVVATLRPEHGPALDVVSAAGERRVATVVELGPLAPAEVRQLAAGFLDAEPDSVPAVVANRLVEGGAGNPYLIEELLAGMIDSGWLRTGPAGWQVDGEPDRTVPRTIVESFRRRVDRLGPEARDLLRTAAVLGNRFALPVAQLATGHDDLSLLRHLRAATQAGFVVPDRSAPDWYSFRHALTADAILAGLLPGERASIARRAAAAIAWADSDLPDERCQLVAGLNLAAGDTAAAARLYAEAGRRALATAGTESAVALLERGLGLAADADRQAISESLIDALADTGQFDRALAVMATMPSTGGVDRVALHTRLAWAALASGGQADAEAQAVAARELLAGAEPQPALLVVEAHLGFFAGQGEDHVRRAGAEQTARTAVTRAEAAGEPIVACQALQLLALLARERGFDEADGHLERMLAVAESHDLPLWRLEALLRLGVNDFMRTGSAARLQEARRSAFALGSIAVGYQSENILAMQAVLGGDHDTVRGILDQRLGTGIRSVGDHGYLLMAAATSAAHRGRRAEMEAALADFTEECGEQSLFTQLELGLCRAVCALLEEDRRGASAELDAMLAWEQANPSVFYLAGRYGLHPLLEILADRAGWPEYEQATSSPAADLRWNRQFLRLAHAVLLGRAGSAEEARQAVAAALEAADVYPTARALGLRLVAEAALADGWGDPTQWLRTAEEYFHAADNVAVAGACRALLRQNGVRVAQRRDGREDIPSVLRDHGVTVREYQVFALLPRRPSNKLIGERLFISPRTAEKHVASLIVKTGQPHRDALCDYAAELIS